jgi:hypothetical protein
VFPLVAHALEVHERREGSGLIMLVGKIYRPHDEHVGKTRKRLVSSHPSPKRQPAAILGFTAAVATPPTTHHV